MICCNCGKTVHKEVICSICESWGVVKEEIFPTVSDVLLEQFHRIGKDGKKYWGKLGAGILFTDGKKVLLLNRSDTSDYVGYWCIPGGRAKEGEVPLDVALREAKEECGVVEGTKFEHFHNRDGSHHWHTYLYAVKKPFETKLSKEHDEARWVDLDKVEGLKLHPKLAESFPSYLRAIKKYFPDKTSFADWVNNKES